MSTSSSKVHAEELIMSSPLCRKPLFTQLSSMKIKLDRGCLHIIPKASKPEKKQEAMGPRVPLQVP